MYIIIPAKPLRQSKSRLAPVLTVEQRAQLSRALLQRTIKLARQVAPVVVVSADSAARQLAKKAGAWALVELEAGLNQAVRQGAAWAQARGAESVLILPSDLPFLTAADLAQLAALGQPPPAVVVAPCRRDTGTNALLLSPPGVIAPAFGPNSFRAHLLAARQAGIEPMVYRSVSVGFDLDLPADLAELEPQPELELFGCD